MRRILYEVSRFAPFLRSQRGALQVAAVLADAAGDPEVALSDVLADGRTVQDRDVAGAALSRWRARSAALRGWRGAGVSWQVVDADGAALSDCDLTGAHLALVSLQAATLDRVRLDGASLVLCDFTAATLRGVSLAGARLDACDFTDAVLEDVDLTGADLRGCVLRGAWLAGASLDGAEVKGADLRGAAGLGAEQRAALAARGARVGGGIVYGLWARVLGGGDPPAPARHAVVRAAMTWTWAVLVSLLPILFFLRATLHPINPDEPPFWEGSWEEPEEPEVAPGQEETPP